MFSKHNASNINHANTSRLLLRIDVRKFHHFTSIGKDLLAQ